MSRERRTCTRTGYLSLVRRISHVYSALACRGRYFANSFCHFLSATLSHISWVAYPPRNVCLRMSVANVNRPFVQCKIIGPFVKYTCHGNRPSSWHQFFVRLYNSARITSTELKLILRLSTTDCN
jgi:hypothetical protein